MVDKLQSFIEAEFKRRLPSAWTHNQLIWMPLGKGSPPFRLLTLYVIVEEGPTKVERKFDFYTRWEQSKILTTIDRAISTLNKAIRWKRE